MMKEEVDSSSFSHIAGSLREDGDKFVTQFKDSEEFLAYSLYELKSQGQVLSDDHMSKLKEISRKAYIMRTNRYKYELERKQKIESELAYQKAQAYMLGIDHIPGDAYDYDDDKNPFAGDDVVEINFNNNSTNNNKNKRYTGITTEPTYTDNTYNDHETKADDSIPLTHKSKQYYKPQNKHISRHTNNTNTTHTQSNQVHDWFNQYWNRVQASNSRTSHLSSQEYNLLPHPTTTSNNTTTNHINKIQFHDSLFNCHTNLWPSCACVFFGGPIFTMYLAAQISDKIKLIKHHRLFGIYILFYILCILISIIFFIVIYERDGKEDFDEAYLIAYGPSHIMFFYYIYLRLEFVKRLNIDEDECTSICIGWFCSSCSICQMARHLWKYEFILDGDGRPDGSMVYSRGEEEGEQRPLFEIV